MPWLRGEERFSIGTMFVYPKQYDVIVVGVGHAGVEAALAAARMTYEQKARTDLESQRDSIT